VGDEEISRLFNDAGLVLSPDALDFLKTRPDPVGLAQQAIELSKGKDLFVMEKSFIEEILKEDEDRKIPVPVEVKRAIDYNPASKDAVPHIRFYDENDVSGQSKCSGTIQDFVGYFRDRVARTRKILEARSNSKGIVTTKALKSFTRGRDMCLVGIVNSKRTTRKGDLLVELEDEEGVAKVWIGKGRNQQEKRIFQKAQNLLNDEVLAVEGKWSDPFVITTDLVWPDVPIRNPKEVDKDLSIAFVSDIHIGSKLFMEDEFNRFIQWINGNTGSEREKELAGKVKYILMAGDVVDGIGIYPSQENELSIKDIYEQYARLAKHVLNIPEYIEVIIAPGNHDAVRRAEPQPRLPEELVEQLNGISNIHLVGNPSFFEIEGLKTYMYHGTSLDSVIAALPGMGYSNPEKPMLELLRRRNFSPIYGGNPIVPEHRDYMVMEHVPDILHMGHVHKNGYDQYHGTLIINSGTWQAQTDFQVKQGHVPSPCLLPIYNMRRRDVSVINFGKELISEEKPEVNNS